MNEPKSLKICRSEPRLERIFQRYVLPNKEGINNYEEEKIKRSTFMSTSSSQFSRTTSSLSKFMITHEQRLYPSADSSKGILCNNKNTYEALLKQLQKLEDTEYKKLETITLSNRRRLSFFKERVRFFSTPRTLRTKSKKLSPIEERVRKRNMPKTYHPVQQEKPPIPLSVGFSKVTMPLLWRNCEVHGWRPEARESGTLTKIVVPKNEKGVIEERLYLFGGLSSALHSSFVYLTREERKTNYSWVLQSMGNPKHGRFGHTACDWEGRLVIVGGGRMFINEAKKRECLDDVLIYYPLSGSLHCIRPEGKYFEPRRYHSAVMIGKHLVVYGGLTGQQCFLSDLMSVKLSDLSENQELCPLFHWASLTPKGKSPGPLANHACQLVLHPDRYRSPNAISLTSLPELRAVRPHIDIEGMYIFGGRDETGPNNRLFVLKIGTKNSEWVEPEVAGAPPAPRYGHSMNYCAKKNLIVVFGGNILSNDVWILSLDRLTWARWDNPHTINLPVARHSHCATVLDSSVIIFGGLGEENYCRSDVYSLDFESSFLNSLMINKLSSKKSVLPKSKLFGEDLEESIILPVEEAVKKVEEEELALPELS